MKFDAWPQGQPGPDIDRIGLVLDLKGDVCTVLDETGALCKVETRHILEIFPNPA